MKILLTGGAGFIGSHLHDRLSSRGHALTVVDDLSAGRPENLPASADLRVTDIVDGPRLANVYGPRQVPDGEAGVVSIFIDRMRRGLPVEIHGDGEQTRDFLSVTDVAEAVEAALAASRSMVVNIGTGQATSIRSLYDQAATVTGFRQDPVYGPARVGDVRHSVLAVDRAKAELGWQARTTLANGLQSTADWLSSRE